MMVGKHISRRHKRTQDASEMDDVGLGIQFNASLIKILLGRLYIFSS
jgi:hypothetical protein